MKIKTRNRLNWFMFLILALFAAPSFSNPVYEITQPMQSPEWALLQHEVLSENLNLLEAVTAKYINPQTGHLECVEHWGGADGPDDAMENFYNWPLLYALGAPKRTLEIFKFIWNGHIEQYTNSAIRDPRGSPAFYREFISAYDWEHNGEGIAPFLLLPLSDPDTPITRERILRFADFYTGRDTSTHNYDAEHKIIRSVFNGSRGPWLSATPEQMILNNNSWRTRGAAGVMGDVPLNLIATSLAVNAYLITGDVHYKNWVIEYTTAWLNRTQANNGIIPSNVGLNGNVGEHWEGKWYGGIMGWDWNFGGFRILGRGMRIGFANGYFLSQNSQFPDALRNQGDILVNNGIQQNGINYYKNNFGDEYWYLPLDGPVDSLSSWFGRNRESDGWYDLRPLLQLAEHFFDLYMWTLQPQDLARLKLCLGSQASPWLAFLAGDYPDYPEIALRSEIQQIQVLADDISHDNSLPSERRSDHGPWPAATEAMVNLSLGGLQPSKSGGLLFCQLRYFDPAAKRPGLPPNIGALVQEISTDKIRATFVNTNPDSSREIIIQCGAYGEHECLKIEFAGQVHSVNNNMFTLRISPNAGAEILIYLNRNRNQPTLLFPWNRGAARIQNAAEIYQRKNFIQLNPAFPNPFNAGTKIVFQIKQKQNLKITIHNLLGAVVDVLGDQEFSIGKHELVWNAKNQASGVYWCILTSANERQVSKILLLK